MSRVYELVKVHGTSELEIKRGDGATKHKFEKTVPFELNGEKCSIKDLRPGDLIELESSVGKIHRVVATRGKAAAAKATEKPASKPAKKKGQPAKKQPAAAPAASGGDDGEDFLGDQE